MFVSNTPQLNRSNKFNPVDMLLLNDNISKKCDTKQQLSKVYTGWKEQKELQKLIHL